MSKWIDKELFDDFQKEKTEEKDKHLVKICKHLGCNEYLSTAGAAEYIERSAPGGEFTREGIQLYYHCYEHPRYPQLYGEFLPYMSVIDLLFNCGIAESLGIIRSGRK